MDRGSIGPCLFSPQAPDWRAPNANPAMMDLGPRINAGTANQPLGNAPLRPILNLPPQPVQDGAPDDGPVSVALNVQPQVASVQACRPCPQTDQYKDRQASRRLEVAQIGQPRRSGDVCGWVQATASQEEADQTHEEHLEHMHLHHNEFRLVFQSISAYCLMQWKSEEEFEAGRRGGQSAPRPIGWIDLRAAHDVRGEIGADSDTLEGCRVTVMTTSGNYYFCVGSPGELAHWCESIRRVIQDASWHYVCSRDADYKRLRRWAAACGAAEAMVMRGSPLGERSMAIIFHAFDVDQDCCLRAGDLMILIREMLAAVVHCEGRAEGRDRDTALAVASERLGNDALFDRAVIFQRRCSAQGDGKVRKDEFIRFGSSALCEALGRGGQPSENEFNWPSLLSLLPF